MVGVVRRGLCLGVLVFDMVESGAGADIAHRDSVEVVVVEGVLVVVSFAREGVHVMNMLAGVGSKRGGVALSGSVSLIEHTWVKVGVGGVSSIGGASCVKGVGGLL